MSRHGISGPSQCASPAAAWSKNALASSNLTSRVGNVTVLLVMFIPVFVPNRRVGVFAFALLPARFSQLGAPYLAAPWPGYSVQLGLGTCACTTCPLSS
jgi:hypothetical protein